MKKVVVRTPIKDEPPPPPKKKCITRTVFPGKGDHPILVEMSGDRFTFWVDRPNSKGFEVNLLDNGIEVRGMGVPPGLTIEPGVSNVITIKLRRQMDEQS